MLVPGIRCLLHNLPYMLCTLSLSPVPLWEGRLHACHVNIYWVASSPHSTHLVFTDLFLHEPCCNFVNLSNKLSSQCVRWWYSSYVVVYKMSYYRWLSLVMKLDRSWLAINQQFGEPVDKYWYFNLKKCTHHFGSRQWLRPLSVHQMFMMSDFWKKSQVNDSTHCSVYVPCQVERT